MRIKPDFRPINVQTRHRFSHSNNSPTTKFMSPKCNSNTEVSVSSQQQKALEILITPQVNKNFEKLPTTVQSPTL